MRINSGEFTNAYVNVLAIDPVTSTTVYAGTSAAGIFKSTDGGETWSPIGTGISDAGIQSLAVDPSNTSILYAGMYSGEVFMSRDGGYNWSSITGDITGTLIFNLTIDPKSGILYAGAMEGLFRSRDGGENWEFMGLKDTMVMSIAIDPTTQETLYAGTMEGAFISTDGGDNWTPINNGLSEHPYIKTESQPLPGSKAKFVP